ncbi:MAG: SAM-dependent methyltransferase [Chloroflexota bacterium]
MTVARQPSSFRDPSGFLFVRDGILYRQVNQAYREDYDHLMASGLYDELTRDGLLIPHEETLLDATASEAAYKVLRPEAVRFVSHPYEWCFSQYKDAALLTLGIQRRAVSRGMSLKDGSAYNVQFHRGRPVLIDTLSFERYREGEPWVAYRQFCQHFLAPLTLMAKRDIRLGQLTRIHLDGVPLDLAACLLPFGARFSPGLLTHLFLHAGAQRRFADRPVSRAAVRGRMGRSAFLGLIDSLQATVRKLSWEPTATEWSDYYEACNYSPEAEAHKTALVQQFLRRVRPATVWDLGANVGRYSRLASAEGAFTVAWDVDPGAVERNYRACKADSEPNLLPLLIDLTNPSPGIGWEHGERLSLIERGPADLVLALALVHHLAIGNNVPLAQLARFLARLARWLVIEFVPKEDSQVQRLLRMRRDIFADYHQSGFERAFGAVFTMRKRVPIRDSLRVLYLMERCHEPDTRAA